MKKLLWVAIVLIAMVFYSACGGKSYSSPTSPVMSGTPAPGPTPTPGTRY